jgi:cytochrome c
MVEMIRRSRALLLLPVTFGRFTRRHAVPSRALRPRAFAGEKVPKADEGALAARRFDWLRTTLSFALLALCLATGCGREQQKAQVAATTTGGSEDRGKQLIDKYGCNACHVIPGISGPKGMVGPPLDHMAVRQIIGGKIQNTPENMMKWLQNPQALDPQNAMPNLGVTPADSRDITAYLYTLK